MRSSKRLLRLSKSLFWSINVTEGEYHVMYKKPLLSIIVAAKNDINTIDACFQSLLNQTVEDFETIFVCEPSSDGTFERVSTYKKNNKNISVRILLRDMRYSYPRFGRGAISNLLIREKDYLHAKFSSGIRLLDKLLIKKVNPYKNFEHANTLSCYTEGFKYKRGKYVTYITPNCIFKPNFIEKCVLPMEQNEDIGMSLTAARQVGEFAILNGQLLCEKTSVFPPKEGMAHYLDVSHLGGIVKVFRCSKAKYLSKSFKDFSYQADVMYRMLYESTLFVSERLVDIITKKDYYEEIFSQAIVSKRFLEIGSLIWRLSTRNDYKFDVQPLLDAYKNSYASLSKTCLDIAKCLKDKGDVKEAKAHIYFAKMLKPDVEIPEELSCLQLIEPSFTKI